MGFLGIVVKNADSARLKSSTFLSKKKEAASATPYIPFPKYIWLRCILKISSLLYLLSIWIARMASFILRRRVRSGVKNRFLASC